MALTPLENVQFLVLPDTLEKFDDCWDELTDINEREIFVYAFKLGARIAIDVLTER